MTEMDWSGLTLDEAEREIYHHILERNPEHDIDPTLDRVRDACDLLGNPQHTYKVIHITGTNGKTSTARMAESLVRAHGLRTGLFTSPHLSSVRERIQIDGEPIDQETFIRLWHEVAPIIHLVDARSQKNGGPRLSFFEVLTVLAYAAFADAPVDVAVIEVGMAGSWDATNVADGDVAVIAPVSLDHTQWLGNKVAGIAREKAGIIKEGATVVISEQSDSVTPVLLEAVAAKNARAFWEGDAIEVLDRQPGVGGQLVTFRTPAATYSELFVPLYGAHQAHNALLALTAVESLLAAGGEPQSLDGTTVEEGFNAVTSPGRMEVVRTSPLILVDAAHNPAGIEAMADAVEEAFTFDHLVGVVGILDDKDAEGILSGLEPLLDHIVVTVSSSPRAIPAHDLGDQAREIFGEERVSVALNLPDALDQAVQAAESNADQGGGVVVVGSVTLVADARILMGADKRKGRGQAR
jgi:dihydrofolate synthase/folylpolyglutamate synthase